MDAEVREFHKKHQFPVDHSLRDFGYHTDLAYLAQKMYELIEDSDLKKMALQDQAAGDERAYRVYLIFEELAETAEALADADEGKLADGIADLHYVTSGTAVTFGLPGDALFDEVHKSNMTKKKRDVKNDPRMRDKGDCYVPPDLESVINKQSFINTERSSDADYRRSRLSR